MSEETPRPVQPAFAEPSYGLPEGVRPLERLAQVLSEQKRRHADLRPLILTHRSPDPDALGAMAGMEFLLREAFGLSPLVATMGRIHRAENVAMVRELELDYPQVSDLELGPGTVAFLLDSQPTFGHTVVPEDVPIVAVFDHHDPPPAERRWEQQVPHFDVRRGVGATASIVYEYIRDAGLELDARTATALCCGVRFDTLDLSVHASELDHEAFLETFQLADRSRLARIRRPTLPVTYYRELHRSLARARRHGPLVFALLGRVGNPESVAEMADFFLRMEGCRWALVGGAYESSYHLSMRTEVGYRFAYPLMERVLAGEGSFGGRGSVAGGQVSLEAGDDSFIAKLERRLRGRALKLVRADDLEDGSAPRGTRLTRL
jgi:nanoRNase/pAp phosphatase (c-di-AMP/oligoRNAs hydrolase)